MQDFTSISEIVKDLSKQSEQLILSQLEELIKRNLLVIESTVPVLVREPYSDKITVQQKIRLVLKDQEYIEKLEKENQGLKLQIEDINKTIRNAFPKDEGGYY